MKIAYLILAHKNPTQLKILIDQLSTVNTIFYIHIDIKADITAFEKQIQAKNVYFILERVNISWGGFSIVAATINLMKNAKNKATRYVLLSGQDFPVKSNEDIHSFFEGNKDINFLNFSKLEDWDAGGYERIELFHPIDFLSKYNIGNMYYKLSIHKLINKFYTRKIPVKATPYRGSQWWAITNSALLDILDFINQNSSFYRFYRRTSVPDEMFFQTIILNLKKPIELRNDDLREIHWNKDYSVKIFTMSDLDNLQQSKKLFARKFDIDIDKDIFGNLL